MDENDYESTLPPLEEEKIPPSILEGEWNGELIGGFDTIVIHLDGDTKSSLEWEEPKKKAYKAIKMGYKILWHLDLGLFDRLPKSLDNSTQFLSLNLSLEHFRNFLWQELKEHTLGVILYQGDADFSRNFPWDEHQAQNYKEWLKDLNEEAILNPEFLHDLKSQTLSGLFCRDVIAEYLILLANRLPDTVPVYLIFNAISLNQCEIKQIAYINPERFNRFTLVLKGSTVPLDALGWEEPTQKGYFGKIFKQLPIVKESSIGICLPPYTVHQISAYQEIKSGICALNEKGKFFRLIPEFLLTAQWDGLDYLLFSPSSLSVQGKRKLQGFCAAGGTPVSTGELIGLPQEIKLTDFLQSINLINL